MRGSTVKGGPRVRAPHTSNRGEDLRAKSTAAGAERRATAIEHASRAPRESGPANPMGEVKREGIEIHAGVDAETSPAYACERWLRDHVIGRIPGA